MGKSRWRIGTPARSALSPYPETPESAMVIVLRRGTAFPRKARRRNALQSDLRQRKDRGRALGLRPLFVALG